MAHSHETVLISGASSGIGEALAWLFAEQGHDLVLVARSEDKLADLAHALAEDHGVEAQCYPADLSKPGAARRLFNAVNGDGQQVDILVNNAGVLEHGAFIDMDATQHQRMIQLNVAGLTDLLSHFLPPMAERGYGRVCNVASIAGFMPVPSLATYAATKAYVLSLSEALAEEMRPHGVSVTALCPGVTATNMVAQVQEDNDTFAKMPGMLISDVDDVAREAFKACMKGTPIVVPGNLNLATTLAARSTPKWLVRRLSGLLGRSSL